MKVLELLNPLNESKSANTHEVLNEEKTRTLIRGVVDKLIKAAGLKVKRVIRIGDDKVRVELSEPLNLVQLNKVYHRSNRYWPSGDPRKVDDNYVKLTYLKDGGTFFEATAE